MSSTASASRSGRGGLRAAPSSQYLVQRLYERSGLAGQVPEGTAVYWRIGLRCFGMPWPSPARAAPQGEARMTVSLPRRRVYAEGADIRTKKTELGTLVTIDLDVVSDGPSTTATLVLPTVNLGDQTEQKLRTLCAVDAETPLPTLRA